MGTINNLHNSVSNKFIDVASQTGAITTQYIRSETLKDVDKWESSFLIGDYYPIKLYGLEYYIDLFKIAVSENDLDKYLYNAQITYDEAKQSVSISKNVFLDGTTAGYIDAVQYIIKSIPSPVIPRLEDICIEGVDYYIDFSYCHGHYLEDRILVNKERCVIIAADLKEWNRTADDILMKFRTLYKDEIAKGLLVYSRTFNVYTERGILTAFRRYDVRYSRKIYQRDNVRIFSLLIYYTIYNRHILTSFKTGKYVSALSLLSFSFLIKNRSFLFELFRMISAILKS